MSSRGKLYKANWSHTETSEDLLRRLTADGITLNVCCGQSMVGDVRVDIAENTSRTEYGDMFDLPFGRLSFYNVICDPPYDYYTTGDNRFRWILKLADMAERKLILAIPKINIRIPHFDKEYYIVEEDGQVSMKLWVVFTRMNDTLDLGMSMSSVSGGIKIVCF